MRHFDDSSVRIAIDAEESQVDSVDSDEQLYEEFKASRAATKKSHKAYTVLSRSGFQHTEYLTIMSQLCKAEITMSVLFLIHGSICPGYPDESAYQGACHMNIVSAIVGILTGGVGIGAVNRYRWRTMLVMWLVMCIISAVGNLLSIINAGVWLDHLSKMKDRTGFVNGLSGVMLLSAVALASITSGVCFILTAVMICHYWNSNSMKYQAVGRVSKRMSHYRHRHQQPLLAPSSTSSSSDKRGKREMQTHQYHVCTARCNH